MQIRIFTIPIGADEKQEEEMNHFLRANKIIDIKKELALLNGNSCWTFCITYMPTNRLNGNNNDTQGGQKKTDYKEVLPPVVFEKFCSLRQLRKQIAEEEAIPAYAVFTDAELAEMAKLQELTLTTIQKISGIGKKKVEKYGNVFVAFQQNLNHEKERSSDGTDSES